MQGVKFLKFQRTMYLRLHGQALQVETADLNLKQRQCQKLKSLTLQTPCHVTLSTATVTTIEFVLLPCCCHIYSAHIHVINKVNVMNGTTPFNDQGLNCQHMPVCQGLNAKDHCY